MHCQFTLSGSKRDTSGRAVRFKVRLVECGFTQKYGRDYRETYSPVASATSIRFVFALSAVQDMVMSQHDIETAFLYGILPEDQSARLLAHSRRG